MVHHTKLTRRSLLRGAAAIGTAGLAARADTLLAGLAPDEGGQLVVAPVTHSEFLSALDEQAARHHAHDFLRAFRALALQTAENCKRLDGTWVVPGPAYANYLFARDSFWVAAALWDRRLAAAVVARFRDDQRAHADGHIATALLIDGSIPVNRDRDEESTMMYVLHTFLLAMVGGTPDLDSLSRARDHILSHVRQGRFVTPGESRTGPAFGGTDQVGTYHYWADTFRPAAQARATPEVFLYNQGLLCVALRCLGELGVEVNPSVRAEAEAVYASVVNPRDRRALPQRVGHDTLDVSALVGEALSLFFWDTPLLSPDRVRATLARLARVYYPDGSFLGFKIISDFNGRYCPAVEFSGSPANEPGDYHNGGSWLLYDILALYVAARHRMPGALGLLVERLQSEARAGWASHEFISTNPLRLGACDPLRDVYGWNSFVANLISPGPPRW